MWRLRPWRRRGLSLAGTRPSWPARRRPRDSGVRGPWWTGGLLRGGPTLAAATPAAQVSANAAAPGAPATALASRAPPVAQQRCSCLPSVVVTRKALGGKHLPNVSAHFQLGPLLCGIGGLAGRRSLAPRYPARGLPVCGLAWPPFRGDLGSRTCIAFLLHPAPERTWQGSTPSLRAGGWQPEPHGVRDTHRHWPWEEDWEGGGFGWRRSFGYSDRRYVRVEERVLRAPFPFPKRVLRRPTH